MFENIAEMEKEIETFRKNVYASSELVESISQLTAETKRQKESFSASTEELLKKQDKGISEFESDCESILSETRSMLETQQNAFAEKLQEAEDVIIGYQAAAESKYVAFIEQLEGTNVDQLYKEIEDLKGIIQSKFYILIGGIGVTLIIAVLGLFLK